MRVAAQSARIHHDAIVEYERVCERLYGRGFFIAVLAFSAYFVDDQWLQVGGLEKAVVCSVFFVAALIGLLLMGAANELRNELNRNREELTHRRYEFQD